MVKTSECAAFGVLALWLGTSAAFAQLPSTDLPVTNELAVQFDASSGITLDGSDRVSNWKTVYWNTASQRAAFQNTAGHL